MSLRGRILLVVVPPVLAMLLVSSLPLAAKWHQANDMARVVQLAMLVSDVGGLVQELQKERGATNVVLGSHGTQFRPELAAQRQNTIAAEASFQAAIGLVSQVDPAIATKLELARSALGKLPAVRAGVDALALPEAESFATYTDPIQTLLDAASTAGVAVPDPAAARSFLALWNFMQAKEHAGQERATGAQGFAARRFSPELYRRFLRLRTEQDTLLQTFQSYATEAEGALYRRIVSGPSQDAVDGLRAVADAGGLQGELAGVDGAAWFKTATTRIDLLRAVEAALTERMRHGAADARRASQIEFWALLGAVGTVTMLVGAIALAMLRSLARPLRTLAVAMTALAAGDITVDIPAGDRADEVGAMARALTALRENRVVANRLRVEKREEQVMREKRHTDLESHVVVFGAAVADALRRLDAAGGAMLATSGRLSGTASEAAGCSADAAIAVSQAALNAHAVVTAVRQLSSSARDIGQQAAAAAEKGAYATSQARKVESIVEGLFVAAEQVGGVVAVVRAMADQASLLALNATIEAARAGVAGKSFAVVASEVKALASQTNQATNTIAAQIATMQDVTRKGVAAVRAIARSVENMGASADAVTAGVEAQAAATDEITHRACEIANSTVELQDGMLKASAAATATGSEAGQVRQAAKALGEQVGVMRDQIEAFTCNIRTTA